MTGGDVFALGVAALAVALGLWVAWTTVAQARAANVTVAMRRTDPRPTPAPATSLPPPVTARVSIATLDPTPTAATRPTIAPSAEPVRPAPRAQVDTPVTVELLNGPDGRWCRITSTDTVPLEVDIFSHRPAGSPASAPWRHLLLDGAVTVRPGVPAIIALGSDVTAAIDVVIGGTAPSRPGRSWRGRLVAR